MALSCSPGTAGLLDTVSSEGTHPAIPGKAFSGRESNERQRERKREARGRASLYLVSCASLLHGQEPWAGPGRARARSPCCSPRRCPRPCSLPPQGHEQGWGWGRGRWVCQGRFHMGCGVTGGRWPSCTQCQPQALAHRGSLGTRDRRTQRSPLHHPPLSGHWSLPQHQRPWLCCLGGAVTVVVSWLGKACPTRPRSRLESLGSRPSSAPGSSSWVPAHPGGQQVVEQVPFMCR